MKVDRNAQHALMHALSYAHLWGKGMHETQSETTYESVADALSDLEQSSVGFVGTLLARSTYTSDHIARNILQYLLLILCLHASTHGEQPVTYYQKYLSSGKKTQVHDELTMLLTSHGVQDIRLGIIILQTLSLLSGLRQMYPQLEHMIDFVSYRITALQNRGTEKDSR